MAILVSEVFNWVHGRRGSGDFGAEGRRTQCTGAHLALNWHSPAKPLIRRG